MESGPRIWEALSWASVLVLFGFGAWWMVYLPTAGIGGLFLAIGAVLMPLFWEKIGTGGKMSWIAMLFLLLAVEYRAIHKDRDDFAKAETSRRDEENRQFSAIGDAITSNVDRIMKQSDAQFKETLTQQSKHFSATIDRLVRVNQEQVALARKQQEMIDSANGHLLPAEDGSAPALESLGCPTYVTTKVPRDADYYVLQLNELKFIVWKFPFWPAGVELWPDEPTKPIVMAPFHTLINLTKATNGDVVFAMDIRDKSGSILIRFDDDGFEVGPQLYKRHPDKSTLIATDATGEQVLKVTYVNKHFMRVQAHIVVDGQLLFDPSKEFGSRCMPNMSIIIERPHKY
jgi:hypothetical protein